MHGLFNNDICCKSPEWSTSSPSCSPARHGDITNLSFFMPTPHNHCRQETRKSVQPKLQKEIR